jgi:hypothetical protein
MNTYTLNQPVKAIQYTDETRDYLIKKYKPGHKAIGEYGEEYELANLRFENDSLLHLTDWVIDINGKPIILTNDIFQQVFTKQ